LSKHSYVIDGTPYEVEVHTRSGGQADVTVNGARYRVEQHAASHVASNEAPAAGPSHTLPSAKRRPRASSGELRAPMAGLVLRIQASAGQELAAGDPVLVLDAMKMENSIRSPHAGVLAELAVREGETVLTGALLAKIVAKS
jgi:biotin carboxyl carrier protein